MDMIKKRNHSPPIDQLIKVTITDSGVTYDPRLDDTLFSDYFPELMSEEINSKLPSNFLAVLNRQKKRLSPSEERLASQLSEMSEPFITRDKPLLKHLNRHLSYFKDDLNILILGPTGSGKDVLANAIHTISERKGPFIVINCSAINAQIFESEIFGHVKGAYTGAHSERKGAFELADGGTLFLDEIGDLPIEQQAKLLRVVEHKPFTRMGDTEEIEVNVRVIAATNLDIKKRIKQGIFRKDFFNRIAEDTVTLSPLQDRILDIPLIAFVLFTRLAIARQISIPPKVSPNDFSILMDDNTLYDVRLLYIRIRKIVIDFQHSTHSKKALQNVLLGEEIIGDDDINSILTDDRLHDAFLSYLENGCSVNKIYKSLNVSKDKMSRDINGILVRLVEYCGSIRNSTSFLSESGVLRNEHTQCLEKSFQVRWQALENKATDKKYLTRWLHKKDKETFLTLYSANTSM